MGKSFQDQLEDTQNKMRNPSQQQQGRHRKAARAAKEAGEVAPGGDSTPTAATSGDRWGEVPGYDATQDRDEMARRERNQKWEGDTGDMRLSKFGYGPNSNYPRSSKDNNAFNFQPDKPPQKVGAEVAARSEREDPRRERQERRPTPSLSELEEIHKLADKLIAPLHACEVVMAQASTFTGPDSFNKRISNADGHLKDLSNALLDKNKQNIQDLLTIKLGVKKLALDILLILHSVNIDAPTEETFNKMYEKALNTLTAFATEDEITGTREIAKGRLQEEGLILRSGLKVLRPEGGLPGSQRIPDAHTEEKRDNPPMKKLQSLFNKNDVEGFQTWHKEYVEGTGLDTYRMNNTDAVIPDEEIRLMKEEMLAPLAEIIPVLMEKKYPTVEDNNRMTSLRTTYAAVAEALTGNPQPGSLGGELLAHLSIDSIKEHIARLKSEIQAIEEELTAPDVTITDEKMVIAVDLIEKMMGEGKEVTATTLSQESAGALTEQEAEKIIADLS